jgi:hypothetical protein
MEGRGRESEGRGVTKYVLRSTHYVVRTRRLPIEILLIGLLVILALARLSA